MADMDNRTPGDKLAEANRHIAHAESLIARQRNVLAELERDGHDTESARDLLDSMIHGLEQMHAHRRIIEDEIRRGEGPAPNST
jgi:hypothetical protein